MVNKICKPQTVTEAKQHLRTASAKIEFLGGVRKHPFQSAGTALVAGMVLGRLNKGRLPVSLLNLAVNFLK